MKRTPGGTPAADPADSPETRDLVKRALAEDIGPGDVTSDSLIPASKKAQAVIIAKGRCVLCGTAVARKVFQTVDSALSVEAVAQDGDRVGEGDRVMSVTGSLRSILAAERTALNFLQRLSGIATLTRKFVDLVASHKTTILDTRKTTPTFRSLEKYAVRSGGGENHRSGLYDRVLIKDNHRRAWGADLAGAVRSAREKHPGLEVEIEVESLEELAAVLPAEPDWILLDNMTPELLRECAAVCAGRCRLEASGGITLENIEQVAATGVDAISLGCLTHSAPAADLSLEVEELLPDRA
ncbi:MAG: carboxylating nicotinate-nucleotide diphosphorylase [Kiritimatiellae bacterium]|nr:carboxylating nicotinate-nucleotide diphosphorylase [Kiritimatiellia bacterium]